MVLRCLSLVVLTMTVTCFGSNATSANSNEFILDAQEARMFTFTQAQSFIELRPTWSLRENRELSFSFRTQLAHGLLVHHGILNPPLSMGSYDLYIKLENGRLRVIHIFNNDITSVFIGQGCSFETTCFAFKYGKPLNRGYDHFTEESRFSLNRDRLHSVSLNIDPTTGDISVKLDDRVKTMSPKSLKQFPNYGLKGEIVDTVLFFGGLNPNDTIWARQYGYEQYIGCLGDVELKVDGQNVTNLRTYSHAQVDLGCVDRCDFDDLCLHKSICVNHYYKVSCDCFGTDHEGPVCGSDKLSTITLRGYSYISYKIYEWVDKVHSDFTRISLTFRTSLDDSVLFYGFGETPTRNYVAASLKNGSVHVSIDFGDGPLEVTLGKHLHNDWWHNLTVLHHGRKVKVLLDQDPIVIIDVVGNYHFHLDPRFYVGGVPLKAPKFGLKSVNNYVGSFREAYFGTVSILRNLRDNATTAQYHGLFPPEYGYEEVEVLPVTFFYPESKIRLTAKSNDKLDLNLDFKTNFSTTVLAHSSIVSDADDGYWLLGIENGAAIISVVTSQNKSGSFHSVKLGRNLDNGKWHHLKVEISDGKLELAVDYRLFDVERLRNRALFSDKIYVGGSTQNPQAGFVGCMRQIKLSSIYMDPRNVIDSDQIEGGEISMDNCQLVDPCARPGVCEHGGKCNMKDKAVFCNCTGTGYTGETCHFSLYRRTCEELFLVGYRKQGVYIIDIDGNGPHPPSYVYCDMGTNLTTTTILTNLPREMVVRKSGMKNFRIDVTYRNFTADMLQTLIRHSKNCTQKIKFDCFKVPLGLWSYTWFKTSYKGNRLSSLGSTRDSYCKCGDVGNCTNPQKMCNCDAVDQRWRHDEAELQNPQHLGITEMYFLQPDNMPPEAELRVTLGPLECIEMDTQQFVITFKTSESYLEIPGWKTGDLAFSFKTSHKTAILFYQPSLYQTHSHFKIFLINENELAFEFSVRGEPKSIIVSSQTPLNSGEWQQVWVDYDRHHVRFTINMESIMIDLEKNEEFGPFEGTLYVGGAPQEYLEESRIKDGFVGCLRGLVINEEVTNLYSYLSPRTPQIVTGCKPSCDPNPCHNGATCKEAWGTFTCECANKLAHTGKVCENNINENGVTFVTEYGHFHQLYVDENEMPPVLTQDILLNIRTYDTEGLLLYAHDQYSNFVQLHIAEGNKLVLTFNSFRMLVQGTVVYNELSRGRSVQIFVDRETEQTILHVNDHKTIIQHPLRLVDKYRQNPWVSGQELETVKPPRPPVEPKPYLQIYLGALDPDSMESSMHGIIGCLTGLRFGMEIFDLVSLVDQNPGTENFRKACKMSCDAGPCKNNGYCIEDWRNMQHTCDCGRTSYFGKFCDEDIGGTFNGTSLVKHIFVPDASTYQRVKVQMAFSTASVFDLPAVLLFVNSKVDERNYIMLALSPSGEIILEEEDGSKRVIQSVVKTSNGGTFTDGVRHWVSYNRNMDNIEFMVDNRPIPITRSQEKILMSEQPKYGGEVNDVVMLGGMEFIDNRFVNYINYSGCLSNVIMMIDSFNIFPLETAYGYRPGGQNLKTVGSLMKSRCAAFRKHQFPNSTPSFADLTQFVGPPWVPSDPIKYSFSLPKRANLELEYQIAEATTKRVGLMMGIFLLILIISVGVYIWRVDWKDKQYRYEEEFGDDCAFSKKPRYLDTPYRGVNYNRTYNGNMYNDPSELTLLKNQPYLDRKLNEIDDPNSEADTKPLEDSEDDIDEPPSDPDSPLKLTPSLQELEWEPNVESGDLESGSMDDLDAFSDDENSDQDPEKKVSNVEGRAPLSSLSENSTEDNEKQSPLFADREKLINKDVSAESPNEPTLVIRRPKKFVGVPQPSPVFLPNNQRSFANPISYLGGPRFQQPASTRNSTESVLSID